ncbi:MAG: biotin/lipoyl-binding protein [Ktedonobacteraceae bacterium]|nr:biotin/lipoyl-binding protein [Ktedonobacteraceae bacterium]
MADTTTYVTTIGQQSSRITLQGKGEQTRVTIDDREADIDWRKIAPLASNEKERRGEGGRYHLIIGERSYEVYARRIENTDEGGGSRYEIQIGEQSFEVSIEDERTRLLAGTVRAGASSNAARVSAPMPGLVIGTPVEAGAEVTAGQTVVALEAMKMENDLASPISGTIKEVRVQTGQTVEQGQVLILVEAEKNA